MQRLLSIGLVILFFILSSLSRAGDADKKTEIKITVAQNPWIDVAFARKAKSKQDGWIVYLKVTNKTGKPLRGLTTGYDMFEGDWKIGTSNFGTSVVGNSRILLKPGQSQVWDWMRNVPSSVDHIHIFEVTPEFR